MGDETLPLDYSEPPAPAPQIACGNCARAILANYYTVNGRTVCPPCRHAVEAHFDGPLGWKNWLRVLLRGGGAALLGTAIYFAVLKITGYELGLIAIVVGLLVGGAVRKASGGRGGWKLQAAAMALTYSSIVASYVPTIWGVLAEQHEKEEATKPAATADEPAAPEANDTFFGRHPVLGLVAFIGFLFGLAAAAPWLAGFQNFMGWIIIGVALYEAWKMNRRPPLQLAGPFAATSAR